MTFLAFWNKLNVRLAILGEPEALHAEARQWYDWRGIKRVEDRLLNRLLNARKPT
jgi:hypothetical protein